MDTLNEQQQAALIALAAAFARVRRELIEALTTPFMSEAKLAVQALQSSIQKDDLLPKAIRAEVLLKAQAAGRAIAGTGSTDELVSQANAWLRQAEGCVRGCLDRHGFPGTSTPSAPEQNRRLRGGSETLLPFAIVEGDLLEQDVEVIVNAWNRNLIPWWLLLPQGVSGAIKRRGGYQPFIEVGRAGPIPLGGAVMTSAGRLPYRAIIHVAGIDLLWRASEESIRQSVLSVMEIVATQGFGSVAFPVIGAGSGGFDEEAALEAMCQAFEDRELSARVVIVRYRRPAHRSG